MESHIIIGILLVITIAAIGTLRKRSGSKGCCGTAGVVNLKKGIVTVSYELEVPDEQIKAKIERVGYTVKEIR